MKKLILILAPCMAFAGTEPINVNTLDGKVKQTSSGVGSVSKPFNFSSVATSGLAGAGTVTSITATAPIVVTPPTLVATGVISITGAALTKTDDTNVTLTLGGTPTTALVHAASLTLGWTGQLSIARGGFGKAMTDPNANNLVAWDDTDGDFRYVTVGSNLTYTHATHTLSAAGGSPGGFDTQVQFNDGSAFGGDSAFVWDKTNDKLTLAGISSTGAGLWFKSSGTVGSVLQEWETGGLTLQFFGTNKYFNGSAWVDIGASRVGGMITISNDAFYYNTFNTGTTQSPQFYVTPGSFALASSGVFGFGSGSTIPITLDTGFARNAAGVVEVNNGTAGQYRELIARSVKHNGVSVANLPTGATAGQVAYVTDGTASLAWGATVTGSGLTPYLVWYNGTNWTVIGK